MFSPLLFLFFSSLSIVLGLSDWDFSQQPQPNLTNPYHQQWTFSTPEVSNEFNLLSDFLGNLYSDDLYETPQGVGVYDSTIPSNAMGVSGISDYPHPRLSTTATTTTTTTTTAANNSAASGSNNNVGGPNPRQADGGSSERARDRCYLAAADPSGDVPEERMKQVLKAKQEAGFLKPFNYAKGYARLSKYMDKNMQPSSRKKILSRLDEFRPKFRERTHNLIDLDLVHVEEWFERSLLEYDRVFASMAVPACLWRRTGEIFRGNKEFAELINVPIEHMRDVPPSPLLPFVCPCAPRVF